ncbi:MFS transporter [Celeribacter sp.]|uniref:MFS transporter n=1 Tax=Celeribacter sp. TaxID=1890673 RepID=UPI003A8F6225
MTQTRIDPRLTILFLWLAGILAAGQFAKISVTFPTFRELYPEQGASLGFLVSAVSVMGVVFGLFAGLMIARIGYKRLLVAAMLMGGVMSIVQAALPPFAIMLASRAIEGVSHLVIVVAAPTMMAQIAPPEFRNTAMTLWGTVFTVAIAIFAFLGLPFVEYAGIAALFLLHGAALIVMAWVMSRILPRLTKGQAMPAFGLRDVISQHLRAYSSARIAAPAAGWVFYAAAFVALVTVLPDFLPQDQRAFLTGILPIAALVVSMTLGIGLMKVFSPVSVLVAGFAFGGLATVALASGVAPSLSAVALLGAMGLIQAGSFSAIPVLNVTAEDQALANGAVAQAGNTGNLIGTPLLLVLIEGFGFAGLIGFALVLFVGGIAVHLFLAARRRAG